MSMVRAVARGARFTAVLGATLVYELVLSRPGATFFVFAVGTFAFYFLIAFMAPYRPEVYSSASSSTSHGSMLIRPVPIESMRVWAVWGRIEGD